LNRHGERLTYPDYGRDEILPDFEGHAMTVVRDDGVHRHLKFRNPATCVYWFELVTWPGVLVINGDCGTYVFARVDDMFTFFRGGNGRSTINPSYWAQKLLATDCHGTNGHREYSEEMGRDALASEMRSLRERGASNEVLRDLRESVTLDEGQHELFRTVNAWGFKEDGVRDWYVPDFWDHRFEDFTRSFIRNLHAIVWGIAQYDASKAQMLATAGGAA